MTTIILDFDGTITTEDTIGRVADFAICHRKENGTDFTAAWDEVLQKYKADYGDFVKNYVPQESDRCTLDQELVYIRGLKAVESNSIDRIQASGLFRGLEKSLFFQAGQDAVANGTVKIRSGFKELLTLAREEDWKVAVVSVNWSASWIRGIISHVGIDVDVIANEIAPDGSVAEPERLKRHGWDSVLATSEDKLEAMKTIVEESSAGLDRTFYFGDSATDLECLIAARGIVVANDDGCQLNRTLRRLGCGVPHISEHDEISSVCWARNFEEVLECGLLIQS